MIDFYRNTSRSLLEYRQSGRLDLFEMIGLHQALSSLLPYPEKKIIQFIGSRKGEGTSTLVRQFSIISAIKTGIKPTLLVDADCKYPSQHLFFDINPEYSWEDVLTKDEPIDKALYQIGESRLFVSLISKQAPFSRQIFESPRASNFWEELRQRFDLILIDSPPAITSSDGLIISSRADGVVLILEAEKTRWTVAESVKNKIIKNGGNLLGVVINKRRYYIPEFIYKRL
jgi:Mrp family chromosome partitioning ATPase